MFRIHSWKKRASSKSASIRVMLVCVMWHIQTLPTLNLFLIIIIIITINNTNNHHLLINAVIPFEVVSLGIHTSSPAMPPLFKATVSVLLETQQTHHVNFLEPR